MAIWVVEFSNGGYKLERFLPMNQRTHRKLLNFENWINGWVSKSAQKCQNLTFKVNFLCLKLSEFFGKNLSNFVPPFENSTTRIAIVSKQASISPQALNGITYICHRIACNPFFDIKKWYMAKPNWIWVALPCLENVGRRWSTWG